MVLQKDAVLEEDKFIFDAKSTEKRDKEAPYVPEFNALGAWLQATTTSTTNCVRKTHYTRI